MVGELQIVVWYFGPAGQLLASARKWSIFMTKVLAATSHDLPFCEGKTGHLEVCKLENVCTWNYLLPQKPIDLSNPLNDMV